MTQWILIVVMSSVASTGGLSSWRQPVVQMQQFGDRQACEAAAEVLRKMVASREARIELGSVATACVPGGTEPQK